mmetsp:Transcript_8215/g.34493  ORF Transcript_8215/g.34493 Transcript_8215/m.34493 type:complete len:258 (-) Transcript_8215:279-1052(-)
MVCWPRRRPHLRQWPDGMLLPLGLHGEPGRGTPPRHNHTSYEQRGPNRSPDSGGACDWQPRERRIQHSHRECSALPLGLLSPSYLPYSVPHSRRLGWSCRHSAPRPLQAWTRSIPRSHSWPQRVDAGPGHDAGDLNGAWRAAAGFHGREFAEYARAQVDHCHVPRATVPQFFRRSEGRGASGVLGGSFLGRPCGRRLRAPRALLQAEPPRCSRRDFAGGHLVPGWRRVGREALPEGPRLYISAQAHEAAQLHGRHYH